MIHTEPIQYRQHLQEFLQTNINITMARNTRTFTDLDLNFFRHPVTNDITVKSDEAAINQSLRNLILTRNFERPFRSYIGSQVNNLLFENISHMTTALMQRSISDVIENFEPRVNLLDVQVIFSPDENSVHLTIIYSIKNTQNPVTVNIILERTR